MLTYVITIILILFPIVLVIYNYFNKFFTCSQLLSPAQLDLIKHNEPFSEIESLFITMDTTESFNLIILLIFFNKLLINLITC